MQRSFPSVPATEATSGKRDPQWSHLPANFAKASEGAGTSLQRSESHLRRRTISAYDHPKPQKNQVRASRRQSSVLFGVNGESLPPPPSLAALYDREDTSTEVSVETGNWSHSSRIKRALVTAILPARRRETRKLRCGRQTDLANFDDVIFQARVAEQTGSLGRTATLEVNVEISKEEWRCKPGSKASQNGPSWRWSRLHA